MDPKFKELLRNNGGPLSPDQLALLRDMQGWIEYCISNGFSLKSTVGVLAHDVNGILANVPGFLPQVTRYAKYRTQLEDLAGIENEPNPNRDEGAAA